MSKNLLDNLQNLMLEIIFFERIEKILLKT